MPGQKRFSLKERTRRPRRLPVCGVSLDSGDRVRVRVRVRGSEVAVGGVKVCSQGLGLRSYWGYGKKGSGSGSGSPVEARAEDTEAFESFSGNPQARVKRLVTEIIKVASARSETLESDGISEKTVAKRLANSLAKQNKKQKKQNAD